MNARTGFAPARRDEGGFAKDAWPVGPVRPVLQPNEVHVWCAMLEASPNELRGLTRLLDATETARADRFRFERERNRWVIARATLRLLLGRYLVAAPASLAFSSGAEGKPALAGRHAGNDVRFNCSHSGSIALFAVTAGVDVGVDVEQIASMPEAELVAEMYFAAGERESLHLVTPEGAHAAFFDCWTRKEAYVKALGGGLSIALDGFEVSLGAGAACRFVHLNGDRSAAGQWSLIPASPLPGYAGAVALPAPAVSPVCWRWA